MALLRQHRTQTEDDYGCNGNTARRKLSPLELASDLANVSRACKVMGYP
jgi:hypothetical protein